MTNPTTLAKTVQPHKYEHLYGNTYLCTSGDSGKKYRLTVENNLVFYTCQCSQFAFRHFCKHGDKLCDRLQTEKFGSRQIPGRIVGGSTFDLFGGDEIAPPAAPRKLTLEDIYC